MTPAWIRTHFLNNCFYLFCVMFLLLENKDKQLPFVPLSDLEALVGFIWLIRCLWGCLTADAFSFFSGEKGFIGVESSSRPRWLVSTWFEGKRRGRKRCLATEYLCWSQLSILKAIVFLRDLGGFVGGSEVSNPVVNLSLWWYGGRGGSSSAGLSNLRPGEACPTR